MRMVPYQNNQLNRFFDDQFFGNFPIIEEAQGWLPALDIVEEKDRYLVKADLPGLKKEDIKITFEQNALRIEGERKSEEEHKDKHVHRIERSYGRFVRVLNLSNDVDAAHVQASYKDGVLEVSLPKSEASKPKTIDIKVE